MPFFAKKNSVCLGSLLSMRSFAIEESNSQIPAHYATLLNIAQNTPLKSPKILHHYQKNWSKKVEIPKYIFGLPMFSCELFDDIL